VGPRKEAQDVTLRSFRQPIAENQLAVLVRWAALRPSCPMKSSS
jgi:hypothetical protein